MTISRDDFWRELIQHPFIVDPGWLVRSSPVRSSLIRSGPVQSDPILVLSTAVKDNPSQDSHKNTSSQANQKIQANLYLQAVTLGEPLSDCLIQVAQKLCTQTHLKHHFMTK